MRQLETEVEQLKRDYVFLMQSSLRINNSDGPETMEVYHYGGNRVSNELSIHNSKNIYIALFYITKFNVCTNWLNYVRCSSYNVKCN